MKAIAISISLLFFLSIGCLNLANDKCKSLFLAIQSEDFNQVETLLSSGAGPNCVLQNLSPLNFALNQRKSTALNKIAKRLIEAGADINFQMEIENDGNAGMTPLSWAVERGNVEMVEYLLKKGADVNKKDFVYGNTPLIRACEWRGKMLLVNPEDESSKDIIKILLKYDVDINLKNQEGWTALAMAKNEGDKETIDLLVAAGASGESEKGMDIRKADTNKKIKKRILVPPPPKNQK